MDTNRAERTALLATEVGRQTSYLMRFARTRIRDEHRAEEAVQETLLAALQCLPSYDGRATLRTWLTGILLHKIHDGFRRASREAEVPDEETPEPADEITPEHALHVKQMCGALARAFEALPPRQAKAFDLREVEGIDSNEVCRALGVSAANLWVLTHRAKAGLRSALERDGFLAAV